MAIFHGSSIPAGGGSGYEITNSLRFSRESAHYLQRSSHTISTSYTTSCWVKRSNIGSTSNSTANFRYVYRFGAEDHMGFMGDDRLNVEVKSGGAGYMGTNRRMRDSAAWCHIVVINTGGGNANSQRLFVNGVEHDYADGGNYNRSGSGFSHNGVNFRLGSHESTTGLFNGYIAEFHFVDGQALTPSDFGETGDYGEWKPIEYTGSHGANGFYLDFKNSSSLGNDASANSNHFTVHNINSHDQMTDSPTNNFCTLNPLDDSAFNKGTFSEGSLRFTGTAGGYFQGGQVGTMFTSNKIYYEWYVEANNNGWHQWGFVPDNYRPNEVPNNNAVAIRPGDGGYHGVCTDDSYAKTYYDGSSEQADSNNLTTGDVVMMAFDPATGKYWYGINGTWVGSGNPSTGANPVVTLSNLTHPSGRAYTWSASHGIYDGTHHAVMNYGQDGTFAGKIAAGGNADGNGYGNFKYAVPTGFLSLCSANLPEPAVKPQEQFSSILYTGTGSARSITGVGFSPDWVVLKRRSGQSKSWYVADTIRGAGKYLQFDGATTELDDNASLASFDSDGITFGNASPAQFNDSSAPYVLHSWNSGNAVSGTTAGSGTGKSYTGSANSDAGFSIISFEGNGTSGHAIPHHLSKAPTLIITKRRSGGNNSWNVGQAQHSSYDWNGTLYMENTEKWASDNEWHNTAPTSTHFTTSASASSNASGSPYIAYCFHNVEGYSAMGTYKGSPSISEPPFVYCGFKPSLIWIKALSRTAPWIVYDNARDTFNPANKYMHLHNTDQETTSFPAGAANFDFLSNGFKIKHVNGDGNINTDNAQYLYIAFAEQPFKYTNAQ